MSTQQTIVLIGAFDTKAADYAFVKNCIEQRGFKTLLMDTGVLGDAGLRADISREEVARAGGVKLSDLVSKKDRGEAVAAMARGAATLLPELFAAGRFQGVIALGGGGGTSVACAAMRALPTGVPKVMVTTVASSDVSGYIGVKDIVMIPSIVDVSGINRISREVYARAAGAICGMVSTEIPRGEDKPIIVASMFGNTTPAVERAKKQLEERGYEVLVFHATGTGGKTMESLIESGRAAAVLDITTTEWADELVGGVLTAGPARLEAAAKSGVPAIVTPGCLDMVNFWKPETVPEKFKERKFYQHNPNITLMRTDVEENLKLGAIVAEKLNASRGPVTFLIPLKGWSMLDSPGGVFWWPEADAAFTSELKRNVRANVRIIEMDCNVNDPQFADRCVECLMENVKSAAR